MRHSLLQYLLTIWKQFTSLTAFIDCSVFSSAFIDWSYVQSHNMHMHCLKTLIELITFNDSSAEDDSITHYVSENFQADSDNHCLTNFYVICLLTWSIVLDTLWLRANWAFLNFDKLQLLISVSLIDVNALESVFKSSLLVLKKTSDSLLSESFLKLSLKVFRHVDIFMIEISLFTYLCWKKSYVIDVITLQNIQKAFSIKKKSDSVIIFSDCWKHQLDVFDYKAVNELSLHCLYNHKISLQTEKTLSFDTLYSMFCDELLMCKKYLKNNLKKDFIRLSKSQAAVSVLFIKKLENELQFCINYWALNIITVKNHYLISLFKKILHWLSQVKWYIKLDIIAAYNALWISSEKEWKMMFHICYSLYKYLIMLFRLINVSLDWQHFINDILWEHLNEFCTAYLNNILIYSDTEKKHIKYVDWVLAQLQKISI